MDHKILTLALKRAYATECRVRRPLACGAKEIFLVDADGYPTPWIVRALPVGADEYFTDSFVSASHVLAYLESQDYATEYLIRTKDGEAIAQIDDCRLMVTTCQGDPLRCWQGESGTADLSGSGLDKLSPVHPEPVAPADYRELGARLGSLHSLPLDMPPGAVSLPDAITLPARDLVWVGNHLASRAEDVPPHFQEEYASLLAVIRSTDTCLGLPLALLHSDAHPGNAVRTPDGQVVLVDWEGSGIGPAIIDLGMLLSSCFDPEFRPDLDAIAGVVDGYCPHRLLSNDEMCRLPDAMRFSTLVLLGGYFDQWASGLLSDEQRIYGMTYRQWQAKLAVIDEIAANASTLFERKSTS